jgi:tetrahydromethanopterin S-methyltransferase subunit B
MKENVFYAILVALFIPLLALIIYRECKIHEKPH